MTNPANLVPRFVTLFRPAGTRSYRLAAGKFFDWGGNGQNPCKPLLRCLGARRGCSLVQPDQAGAEALVVANLTRPGAYRSLFKVGIKPHTFLALHIFGPSKPHWFNGLPLVAQQYLDTTDPTLLSGLPGWMELNKRIMDSDTTESDRPYYSGKRTAHARSYKMGWKTFQLALLKDSHGTMVLNKQSAERFLHTFDRLFPEIGEWQFEVIAMAKACGELRNLFGFPRHCGRIFTASYERELISWIPQSTVGCITHKAVLAVQKLINDKGLHRWNIINNKHDSFLLEVPDSDINDAAVEATSAMAVDLVGRDNVAFTMKSEVQVGKVWAPFNKKDPTANPDGMKGYTIV